MAKIRKRAWRTARGEEKSAWIADYFDQAGKRHIKTFPTRKAADAWLVNARGEVQRGVHTPENASITVSQAADLWLERCELEGLERSTQRQYRNHANLHIKPRLGASKLARLNTPRIEAFRDELLKVLSRALARKVLTSLKSIISEAQRRGLVAHNPAAPVKVDARRREQRKLVAGRDFPTKLEAQALMAAAAGRWRPFIITALLTGLRASEMRALTWDAVDFERNVLHVRQRANLWCEIGPPKSAAGEREVPMSPMVANALKEWRLACPRQKPVKGERDGKLWLVFPNGAGRVENHGNIMNRGFGPLQHETEMVEPDPAVKDDDGNSIMRPRYGIHALRHFFASWVIERGFTPKKVQELMGHSSIQVTFDTYGHLFPSLEDDHAKFAAGELALIGAAN